MLSIFLTHLNYILTVFIINCVNYFIILQSFKISDKAMLNFNVRNCISCGILFIYKQ